MSDAYELLQFLINETGKPVDPAMFEAVKKAVAQASAKAASEAERETLNKYIRAELRSAAIDLVMSELEGLSQWISDEEADWSRIITKVYERQRHYKAIKEEMESEDPED